VDISGSAQAVFFLCHLFLGEKANADKIKLPNEIKLANRGCQSFLLSSTITILVGSDGTGPGGECEGGVLPPDG